MPVAGSRRTPLVQRGLTYEFVGATGIESEEWKTSTGPRSFEASAVIGRGETCWVAASDDVLTWKVKSRSGFTVESPHVGPARQGDRLWLIAGAGPLTVREPIEVIAVVQTEDRCGLAYGTLDGHPVSGEEAFIVSRDPSGAVRLTIRSLSTPGKGVWRAAWPVVRLAQHAYRRRYLHALSPTAVGRSKGRSTAR